MRLACERRGGAATTVMTGLISGTNPHGLFSVVSDAAVGASSSVDHAGRFTQRLQNTCADREKFTSSSCNGDELLDFLPGDRCVFPWMPIERTSRDEAMLARTQAS